MDVGLVASAEISGLDSALDNPSPDSTFSRPAITGRRVSPSMSSTSSPSSANDRDRLMAVVVVPSPPNGAVSSTRLAPGPIARSSRARKPRTASSKEMSVPNRGALPRCPGSSANVGRSARLSSFARPRTVRSAASRVSATPVPSNSPATRPIAMLRTGTGLTGLSGMPGCSMTVALATGTRTVGEV